MSLVTIADFTRTHIIGSDLELNGISRVIDKLPGITFATTGELNNYASRTAFTVDLTKSFLKRKMEVTVTWKCKVRNEEIHEEKEVSDWWTDGTGFVRLHNCMYRNRRDGMHTDYHVEVKLYRSPTRDFNEMVENLTDVVLVAGRTKFHVNKAILAAQSLYFRTLFYETHLEQAEVEVEDIEPELLRDMLQIIYHVGDVCEVNMEPLLEAFKAYGLCSKTVTEKCRDFLWEENFLSKNEKARIFFKVTKSENEEPRRSIDFSAPDPILSDVVLVVGEEEKKFHVNKATLATHSSFFYSMFYSFHSSESEIRLTTFEPKIFQALLEVIYHIHNINDDIVEGLLEAARMYDVKIASDQCYKFLKAGSHLSDEEKRRLAIEYNLFYSDYV